MQILGHRGAKGEYPENTLGGIQFALTCGVSAIEIDVHLTRDGELVVIHDDTLDRTTNLSGKVSDLSFLELQKAETEKGEKIPTFLQVLELLSKEEWRHIHLSVELKAFATSLAVVKVLQNYKRFENISIISFNHRWCAEVKKLCPKVKTFLLLYGLPLNPVEIIKSAGADGISLSLQWIDKKLVDECHEHNYQVVAWNLNDPQMLPLCLDMGLDFLGTDYPSILVPALRDLEPRFIGDFAPEGLS